jgi:hypothetical protein
MSRTTLRAVESDEPAVTRGFCANVLHSLGLHEDLGLAARDDERTQAAGCQAPDATPSIEAQQDACCARERQEAERRLMAKQRLIEVVADWVDLGGPTLMGRLTATPTRGKEVFAFEYDKAWLSSAPRYGSIRRWRSTQARATCPAMQSRRSRDRHKHRNRPVRVACTFRSHRVITIASISCLGDRLIRDPSCTRQSKSEALRSRYHPPLVF